MAGKDIIAIKTADGSEQSFVWENVAGNGDCFYESIAKVINLRNPSEKETRFSVRIKIADYLYEIWGDSYVDGVRFSINDRKQDFMAASRKTGLSLITADLNSDDLKKQYTDLIRIPEVFWADGVSIAAAAKLFDLNIVAVNNYGEIISGTTLSIDDTKETIYLNFVNGNHYLPLIPLSEKIAKIWRDNLYDSTLLYEKANQIFMEEQPHPRRIIPKKSEITKEDEDHLINLLIADLRAKSDEELRKFYEDILKLAKKSSVSDTRDVDQKQNSNQATINNFFQGLIEAFSSPEFSQKIGKLVEVLFGVFRKIILAFNPGIELDESEKAWPYKDQKPDKATKNFYNQLVEIFDSVGEPGRKLYRSLLTRINQGEVLTSEQMLYELLKEVKNSTLFKKNGHEIMSKIEDLLCGDTSKIKDRIERQLTDAFSYFYNISPDDALLSHPVKDGIVCGYIIDDIKKACDALVNKIKDLKEKLTTNTEGLSESAKFNLWQILQTSRLKLSNCLLKIKAFSQGTTALAGGDFYEKFEKFSDKIADDITRKEAVEALGPTACADVSQGKSILKLFECLDRSGNMVDSAKFDTDFATAVTKAKKSRKKEIEEQIAVDGRIDSMVNKLTEVRDIFAPADEYLAQINTTIGKLENLKHSNIQVPTTIDSFDVEGYTDLKQRANDYIGRLSFLEGCANRIIAGYINPAPQRQFEAPR